MSRWNWSKALSELQTKVTFSPDLTTGPPWAEREGFLDRPGRRTRRTRRTLTLEHKITLVLSIGLTRSVPQEKHCNEKATHCQERKPHSKGYPAQGKLQK
jgi:hypothetical protein